MEFDDEYQDFTITNVRNEQGGYSITRSDGWSSFVPFYGGTPMVGDPIRFYGKGIGYPFRGIVIDGITVLYASQSKAQAQWEHEASLHRKITELHDIIEAMRKETP